MDAQTNDEIILEIFVGKAKSNKNFKNNFINLFVHPNPNPNTISSIWLYLRSQHETISVRMLMITHLKSKQENKRRINIIKSKIK